jgi:hypothetical protein
MLKSTALAEQIRQTGEKSVAGKFKKNLKIVILNLYHSYSIDQTRYVAYSRNSST